MPEAALRRLFDDDIAIAVLEDFSVAEPLHEAEQACVARAVDKRRREYAAGRTCARRALARAGCAGAPTLVSLPDRRVHWPEGFIGTLSHAEGLAAAAAASADVAHGLGLDVERRERLEEKLYGQIASPDEIAWIRAGGVDEGDRATVLFSAKEAFYKAQYVLSETFLGFHDVRYHVHAEGFSIELLRDVPVLGGPGQCFVGRLAVTGTHVLTAVTIRR